jgi:DNA-binding transcriptional MerR regulator
MLSIGEFASLGMVSVRTLRHYDEIGLLPPAHIDQQTGYRTYSAAQLGQLNRILALKGLGLSLSQAKQLLDGITPAELRGMLLLRRAQLEHELEEHQRQLLGVEARLRYIEREGVMPADDIIVKMIPAMGVVEIRSRAENYANENMVRAVNDCAVQFDQLKVRELTGATGPLMIISERSEQDDICVRLALAVTEPPGELPAAVHYAELPEIEAATTVRSGPAASIFPMVYQDLASWADAHNCQTIGAGRLIWVHEVSDADHANEQVFEIQLPFTRPEQASVS